MKVEEDATLSKCTIEEKIAQPDWGASRLGLPMASYAFAAATSKEASTQLIDSSHETDICARRASITAWSTLMRQSSAGGAGTVNPCRGVEPDIFGLSF